MKKLVFIGGGHAHMEILANMARMVARGYRVTLVAPAEYHYYSGMGPGMLGGTYLPGRIRFDTGKMVRKAGATFIRDYAVRIDPFKKRVHLRSGSFLDYHVLSCNVGSRVPLDLVKGARIPVFGVKPIEKLVRLQAEIIRRASARKIKIGIVGGGPSAAEIAGNIWQLATRRGARVPQITILAGRRFLPAFREAARRRVLALMKKRNQRIVTGEYAATVAGNGVITESGRRLGFDLVILATGVRPSCLFKDSGLPVGPDQGLLVNPFLQSPEFPEIFAAGDCIFFESRPLPKLGVYAVRQNPVLLNNVLAQSEGRPLQSFVPGKGHLLILNLGGGKGLLTKGRLTLGGKPAFIIKDFIDRRFVAKYKVLE